MDKNTYIELNRGFTPIPETAEFGADYEDRVAFGLAKPIRWKELLDERRVIILAEAGTGKTEEIRHITVNIRGQGKPAFFIRLEYLVNGLDGAFESDATGTYAEFQQWLTSGEDGWLFLDSVDEAKLESPRNFERAIRTLSASLGDARQRAHVFITSRITEWRPRTDLILVNDKLPFIPPIARETSASAGEPTDRAEVENDIISIFDGDEVSSAAKSPPKAAGAKVFSLAALVDYQIKAFAEAKGIANSDAFLTAINRNDAHLFASRPKDLLDLIGFWKLHARIGTPLELIKSSIDTKLQESDPDRAKLQPLAMDKAYRGAQLLAAAATLMKEPRIWIPDRDLDPVGIVATTILRDWSGPECSILLDRPIFDEAIYGTVRFHHRTVREFMTAEWLNELLKNGNSRRQVENLFFKTQYGVPVIVPTMRPILPWLALLDERIREKAYALAPDALLAGGDPAQFPPSFREQIVTAVCTRQEMKAGIDHSFDIAAIQRFARPDMGPAIKALLARYGDNRENQRLLLRMVWQGGFPECLDECFAVAIDTSLDQYLRITAIRGMAATNIPPGNQHMIDTLVDTVSPTDHRIFGELIESFAPRLLTWKHVLDVLERMERPERYGVSSLSTALKDLVAASSPEQIYQFIQRVAMLIAKPPFVERRHYEVSEKYSWLLPHAAMACERLVRDRHPLALEHDTLAIISFSSLAQHYDPDRSEKLALADLVPAWQELNYYLFWHDVAEAREENQGEKRLTQWWHAQIFRDYWQFDGENFEQIAADIGLRPFLDDKLVALSLAFRLYVQNDRPKAWLTRLKAEAKGETEVEATLQTYLHPPKQSEEDKRWKKQEAGYKRRQEERAARDALNRQNWSKWLAEHVDSLRDVRLAAAGSVWKAQDYLRDRLRELAEERNRWAYGNWQDLIATEGREVAEAFRDGAIAYWRHYTPLLRSEGIEDVHSVPHGVVFGLCGLEMEANANAGWAQSLSPEEASLACRYAFWEMNGFPEWMPKLLAAHRNTVRTMLLTEIEWELRHAEKSKTASYVISDLGWRGDWVNPDLASDILTLLSHINPENAEILGTCIKIVVSSENITNSEIASLASAKALAADELEIASIWFSLWASVDAGPALSALKTFVEAIPNGGNASTFSMQLAVNLIGKHRANLGARQSFRTVEFLKEIYLLFHAHIRVADDLHRENSGVYSPTLRDDAQEARNQAFSMLQEIPGKPSFTALKELAELHPDLSARPWMLRNANQRAETDADMQPWPASDFVSFLEDFERPPHNHAQLFDLTVLRLLDLKDEIENGDDSIAKILVNVDQETILRNYIGKWLRDHAKARYSNPQEEELADAKRPDLRIHGVGFDNPVPVEFKIADNDWTGPKLFERLENQLCNDYLRDPRSDSGVFLMLYRGTNKKWTHPVTGVLMGFDQLVLALQEYADIYIAKRDDIQAIRVIGIDLTKRTTALRFVTTDP